jgi:hypothetical protein
MELDRTRIAIRERGLLEIMDLSLRVIRAYAAPLFNCWLLGALPFAVLNALLLGRMIDEYEWGNTSFRYTLLMVQLVFLQAPLAMAPVTLYLGNAMFYQSTAPRKLLREWVETLWPQTWCHGVYRGVLLSYILVLFVRPSPYPHVIEFLLPLLCMGVAVVRSVRPFISEIILLERNPLRKKPGGAVTVARRSGVLHGPASGDLLARWMGAAAIGCLLTLALGFALWSLQLLFLHDDRWSRFLVYVAIPPALWLSAGLFAVIRFFSYLDLRIRSEGWEVELRLRAEAVRLMEHINLKTQ